MDSIKLRVNVTAQDLMGPVVKVGAQTSLRTVARHMLEHQVEAVVVVDAAGEACSLITDQAVLLTEHSPHRKSLPPGRRRCVALAEGAEALYSKVGNTPACAVLSETIVTVAENEPITHVLERMLELGVECAVVVRDRLPVGLLGRRDLLQLVASTDPKPPHSQVCHARAFENAGHGQRW